MVPCGSTTRPSKPRCLNFWADGDTAKLKFGFLGALQYGAAPRWYCLRIGPTGDASGWNQQHPRRDRVPQDPNGPRPHVECPGPVDAEQLEELFVASTAPEEED